MTCYIFLEGLKFATYSLEPIYELFNLIIWKPQIPTLDDFSKNKERQTFIGWPLGHPDGECWIYNSPVEGKKLKTSMADICSPSRVSCYLFIFFYVYFWEWETEREWGRGRERDIHTEPQAGSRLRAVSTEPDMGLEPMNREIMTWVEVGRLTDWATQAPLESCY